MDENQNPEQVTLAQTIAADIQRDAQMALSQEMENPRTSDQYLDDAVAAKRWGMLPSEVAAMTPAEKAQKDIDRMNFTDVYDKAPVYAAWLSNPEFSPLVKSDPSNNGLFGLETLWWKLAGKPGPVTSWWDNAVNAVARGGYGLANSVNVFQLDAVNTSIDRIRAMKRQLDQGVAATEVFGVKNEQEAVYVKNFFELNYEQALRELFEKRFAISKDIGETDLLQQMFPGASSMEEVAKAEGLWDATKAFLSHPVDNMTNVGLESLISSSPSLLAGLGGTLTGAGVGAAAGSLVGPAGTLVGSAVGWAVGMALSGYASWNIDRNATIAGAITEQLYKNGVITNEALESIVSNRGFYQAMTEKAEKHAGPVAALDAASFGLARLTPFGAVTRLAGGGAGAARWAARGDHLFQFGLQGSLGAGGEALGQINAEGKVVSWGDVVAEFAGEGFTAPVEVAAATGRFLARSVDERNQAQVRSEIMKKAGEIAKASAVVQAAPETATEYISEVGQRTEADTVLVDAESLHQEGLADKLAAVSPSAAAQMEEARRTGTEIAIPVEEFLTKVAPTELNDQLAEFVHLPEQPSLRQAQETLDTAVAQASEDMKAATETKDPKFKESLKRVAEDIESQLDGAAPTEAEKKTLTSLLTSLVATLARDSGMSPETIWAKYGTRTILGPQDVERSGEGGILFKTKKAKDAVAAAKEDGAISSGLADSITEEPRVEEAEAPTAEAVETPDTTAAQAAEAVQSEEAAAPSESPDSLAEEDDEYITIGQYLPDLRVIIRWFEGNQSTLLHETGHLFLEMRLAILDELLKIPEAQRTNGQKKLIKDTEDVLAWFGVKGGIQGWKKLSFEERRPFHEKFARHYEAYLFEGHAPNSALQRVFRLFSKWLKNVYGAITAIPEVQMSDDVRELFDRLFITDAQISEAKLRRSARALLTRDDFASLVDDPEAMEQYLEELEEHDAKAAEELRARLMADMQYLRKLRGRKLEELRAQKKSIYDEYYAKALADLKKTKIYQVAEELVSGIHDGDKHLRPKLLRKDLEHAGLTEEQIKAVEAMDMVYDRRDKGATWVDGEAYAKKWNYGSLSEMAQELIARGDITKAAEEEASKQFAADHQEFKDEASLEKAADDAIHNEAAARILTHEINALEKTRKRVDTSIFMDMAQRAIGGNTLYSLRRTNDMRNRAAELGKKATDAFKKGDFREAARLKRQQLFALCKAIQAERTRRGIASALKRYKNLARSKDVKGLETRYLIMIQRLLAAAGINVRESLLRDSVPLPQFLQDCAEQDGIMPDVAPDLVERLQLATQRTREQGGDPKGGFLSLTADELQELQDAIQTLVHIGRAVNKARVGEETMELLDVTNGIIAAVEANAEKHKREAKGDRERIGWKARVSSTINKIGLSHARIPSLLATIEGTRFGRMFEAIVKPADAAGNQEVTMKAHFTKRLSEIFKPLWVKNGDRPVYHASVGVSIRRSEVIALALNFGNQGNVDRLVSGSHLWRDIVGNKGGLTEEEIRILISETLTAEELQAVQQVWDLFAELTEPTMALQKRLTGRTPKRVEARPIDLPTADGHVVHLEGGYYPIVYDARASDKGATLNQLNDIMNRAAGAKGTPQTYGGFVLERAKSVTGLAVTLTPRGAFEGIDHVIHRLCWEEWVVNTNKILKNIGPTLRDYWGSEVRTAIADWVEAIARGTGAQNQMIDEVANFMRQNISLAGIGFNVITALVQPIGMFNSIPIIGTQWVLRGSAEFVSKGPRGAARYVNGKSQMMADRMRTRFRELTEIQARATGGIGAARDTMMRWAYVPIMVTQALVDIPTWLGAYNKALYEGRTEEDAVAVADRTVIDAQGGGRLQDLSAIERGGAFVKLMTVFYTFFNSILNNAMVSVYTKGKIRAAADLCLILLVQPAIEKLVREAIRAGVNGGDQEKWWEESMKGMPSALLSFNSGLLVGLRELGALGEQDYQGPGGLRKVTDVYRLVEQIGQGEVDDAFIKAGLSVLGSFTGVPTVPLTRAYTGYRAKEEGQIDNSFGMIFGYSPY